MTSQSRDFENMEYVPFHWSCIDSTWSAGRHTCFNDQIPIGHNHVTYHVTLKKVKVSLSSRGSVITKVSHWGRLGQAQIINLVQLQ